MTEPSSSADSKPLPPLAHAVGAPVADQSGAIAAFVALLLVVILGMAALSIDLGRGYVVDMRLSRAVDAGVLSGARNIRFGHAAAEQNALMTAALNGADGTRGVDVDVQFGENEFGETTVSMSASTSLPTTFWRALGRDEMEIRAEATAAVPPVQMDLVLDQSGSLEFMGAWDDLQEAAKRFIDHFDDRLDQVGLVSFQARATERSRVAHFFKAPIHDAIDAMRSAGDTNTGEGLRLALEQMEDPGLEDKEAARVLVFFTDGRPTAFRDMLGPPQDRRDRVISVQRERTGLLRGYFDDPESLPTDASPVPDGCRDAPECWGWNEEMVREEARQKGIAMADQIRDSGIIIYAIGLGNPLAADPLLTPDLDYLRLLANEGGIADRNQPQGRAYFAPSAEDLQRVFDEVAQDLLVHLTR